MWHIIKASALADELEAGAFLFLLGRMLPLTFDLPRGALFLICPIWMVDVAEPMAVFRGGERGEGARLLIGTNSLAYVAAERQSFPEFRARLRLAVNELMASAAHHLEV